MIRFDNSFNRPQFIFKAFTLRLFNGWHQRASDYPKRHLNWLWLPVVTSVGREWMAVWLCMSAWSHHVEELQ